MYNSAIKRQMVDSLPENGHILQVTK